MTLRLKFFVLLSLVAASVIVSLATAIWSASVERSAARTVLALPATLNHLARLRHDSELLRQALANPDPHAARDAADNLVATWQRIERDPDLTARLGVAAHQALQFAVTRTTHPPRPGDARAADIADTLTLLSTLDRLIDRSERQILSHGTLHIEDNQRLRQRILKANLFAILGALLMSALAWILLRRWVVTPVNELRIAAARISRGDFNHRLAVSGRDEIAQLNAEVNHMAGMILAMQRDRIEQERFAAIGQMVRRLAHNLRNPLAGIRGLAELTRDELTDDDLRQNQQRIVASVDKFEQWLAELLDVTAPHHLRLQPVEPRRWITDLVDAHRPMAQTRAVTLNLHLDDAPDAASFDPRHLGHALVAILSNAIEACRRNGAVTITLDQDPQHPHWSIHIADEGEGIPPELIERIFAAHFTTKATGNGIGLAVTQQIVRAHHGRITVDGGRKSGSDTPQTPGATFHVTLPLHPPDPDNDEPGKTAKLENPQWRKF